MNRSRVRCRRRNNNLLRTPGLRKDLLATDNALGISHLTTRVVEAVPWTAKTSSRHVASTSELEQNSAIKSVKREGRRRCLAPARKAKNLKFTNGIRIRTFRSLKRIKAGVPSMLSRHPPMPDATDSTLDMTEKSFAIKEGEKQTLLQFVSPAPDLLPCCNTLSLTRDVCTPSIQHGLNTTFPSHFEETVIEGFSVLAFNSAGDMLLYSRMAGAEMLAKDAAAAAAAVAACSLENGGTSAATRDRPSRRSRAAALASAGGDGGGGASCPTGHGNKRALSSLPASGLDQATASKMDELQDLTAVGGHSSSLLQPLSIDTDDLVHDIEATPEALLSDRGCHLLAFHQSQSENGDPHGSPKAAASLSLSSSSASPSSSSMVATNHITPTDALPGGFSKHEVVSTCDRVRRSCSFTGSDTSPPDLSPVHQQTLPSQHRKRTPKTARSAPNRKMRWSQGKNSARDEDPFVTASGSCFSGLKYSRAPPGIPASAPLLSPAGLSPSKLNTSNAIAEDKSIASLGVKAQEGDASGESTKSSVPADQLATDNAVPVLTKSMSRFSIAVLTGDDSACPNLDPTALPAVTSVSSSFVRPVVSTTPPRRTPHQTAKKGLGTPVSPSSSSKRSPTTCKSRVSHRSPDVKPSLPLSNGAAGAYDTLSYPPVPSPPCSSSSTTIAVGAFPFRQSSEWFSKLSRLSNTNSLSEEQVVEIAQHILYDPVFREGVTALPCFDDLSTRLALIWSRLFDPPRSCPPQSFEQFPLNAFNTHADLLAQLAYTKPPENLPPAVPFDGGFPCRPPFIPLLTPLPNTLLPGGLPFSMGPPPLHLPSFIPPQLNGRSYDELPAMPGLTPAPFRPGLPPGHSQPCASDLPVESQSSVHSKHPASSFTSTLSASDSSQKAPWVPSASEFVPSGWDAWESVLGSLSTNSQIQRKLSNPPAGAVDLSVTPCQSVPSFGQLTSTNPLRSHGSVKPELSGSCSRSSKGPSSSGMPLPTEFKLPHLRDCPLIDQRDYQNPHPVPASLAYMGRKHSPKQPSIPRFCNVLKLENTVPGNGSNAHVRIAFHIVRDKYASSFNLNSSKSRLPWFNNSRLPRPRATRPSGRTEKRTTVGNFPSVTSTNLMPPLLPSPATPAFNSPPQLSSQFTNPEEFMAKFLENMFSQLPAAAAAAAAFPNMAFNMTEMQEHFSRALDSNHLPLTTPNPVTFEGSVPGPPAPSSVIDLTRPERIPQMLFPPPPPPPPQPFQTSSRPTASSQTTSEKTRYSKTRTPICTNAIKRSCDPGFGLPSEAGTRTSHNQPQRHGSPLTRFPTTSAGMPFLKPPAPEPVRAPEGANGASATCALDLEAKRRRFHASDGPEFDFTAAAAAAAVASRLRASPKDRRDWSLGHAGSSRNLPPPEPSSATMQSLLNVVGNCHRSHQNLNPL
uniref:Uncharacterized protein n=1 Tax=Schistocephalus solidus TaxID=70667 RepID=A0A0X3Q1M1_SCHSO